MTKRSPLHIAALVAATLGAAGLWLTIDPHDAAGQMQHTGNGTVEIKNETERQLFWSLICACGCPRETLGTCPCDIASRNRSELRAMLEEGKTVEQAQDAYVARFGPKTLAVPRNQGANRLLYVVPLVLIIAGAAVAVTLLRRWARRSAEIETATAGAKKKGSAKTNSRDAYDDKLDDELRGLDDE